MSLFIASVSFIHAHNKADTLHPSSEHERSTEDTSILHVQYNGQYCLRVYLHCFEKNL